jgi:hypothetical protein
MSALSLLCDQQRTHALREIENRAIERVRLRARQMARRSPMAPEERCVFRTSDVAKQAWRSSLEGTRRACRQTTDKAQDKQLQFAAPLLIEGHFRNDAGALKLT